MISALITNRLYFQEFEVIAMMDNKGIGNYDQTVLKLTYSITQLVNGLESRLNQAKEYELLLFGYQISALINLLVRLHVHIHNKQIAHSFFSERHISLDSASETYTHVLASLARLSGLVNSWNFPHPHIKAFIEDHLRQLQAFYLAEKGTKQTNSNSTHKSVVREQEEHIIYEVPRQIDLVEDFVEDLAEDFADEPSMPAPTPPLLENAARIHTVKHRKVNAPSPPLLTKAANIPTPKKKKKVRAKPAAKVVKVRAQKKMKARRALSHQRPSHLTSSVVVRIGNVTKVM